jgi:hypothetical protein
MLTDADRHELYESVRDWLGERPATLFMTTLSPHDPDEVATKADLRELRAELRIEMREMFDSQFHRMVWTNVGTMIALVGLVLAAQAVN